MIGKLIKAIGGGGPIKDNPPIYVKSANDPRYKMYQDSLNLYNQGLNPHKNYSLISQNTPKTFFSTYSDAVRKNFWQVPEDYSSKFQNNYPYKNSSILGMYNEYNISKNKPIVIKRYISNGLGNESMHPDFINQPVYKKPAQPVIVNSTQKPSALTARPSLKNNTFQSLIPSQPVTVEKTKSNVPLVNPIKYTQADEKPTLIQAPVNQLPSVPSVSGNWIKKEQLSNTSGPGGYNYYVNDRTRQTMTEGQYNALQDKYNPKPIQYRNGGEVKKDPPIENPFLIEKDVELDAQPIYDRKNYFISGRPESSSKTCSGGTCDINVNRIATPLGITPIRILTEKNLNKLKKEGKINDISVYGGTDKFEGGGTDSWNFAGVFKMAGDYVEYMKNGKLNSGVAMQDIPIGSIVNVSASDSRAYQVNKGAGLGSYTHTAQVAFYDNKGTPYVVDHYKGMESAQPLENFIKRWSTNGDTLVWSPKEYKANNFNTIKNRKPDEASQKKIFFSTYKNRAYIPIVDKYGQEFNYISDGYDNEVDKDSPSRYDSETEGYSSIGKKVTNLLISKESENVSKAYPNLSLNELISLAKMTPAIGIQENKLEAKVTSVGGWIADLNVPLLNSNPSVGAYQIRVTSVPKALRERMSIKDSSSIEKMGLSNQSVLAYNILAEHASNVKRALQKNPDSFKDVAPNMNEKNYLDYIPYLYNRGTFSGARSNIKDAKNAWFNSDEKVKRQTLYVDPGSYAAKVKDYTNLVHPISIQQQIENAPSKFTLPGGQQIEFTPQMKKAALSIADFIFGR